MKFKKLVSDNGKEFNNEEIERLAKKRGVSHQFISPHYHQENGRVERVFRALHQALNKRKGPIKGGLVRVTDALDMKALLVGTPNMTRRGWAFCFGSDYSTMYTRFDYWVQWDQFLLGVYSVKFRHIKKSNHQPFDWWVDDRTPLY